MIGDFPVHNDEDLAMIFRWRAEYHGTAGSDLDRLRGSEVRSILRYYRPEHRQYENMIEKFQSNNLTPSVREQQIKLMKDSLSIDLQAARLDQLKYIGEKDTALHVKIIMALQIARPPISDAEVAFVANRHCMESTDEKVSLYRFNGDDIRRLHVDLHNTMGGEKIMEKWALYMFEDDDELKEFFTGLQDDIRKEGGTWKDEIEYRKKRKLRRRPKARSSSGGPSASSGTPF